MFLKELYITSEIRCPFKLGLNILLAKNHRDSLDDGSVRRTSDTNGVGKSTIILAVKHCLKGDIGDAFQSNYFANKKYWANLEVRTSNNEALVLIRPLWFPLAEEVFIVFEGSLKSHLSLIEQNGIQISELNSLSHVQATFGALSEYKTHSKDEYSHFLNRIENIDYSKSNISFPSLLDYIIRDEKRGFSDPISLPSRKEWVQYRAIQFLFGLPAEIEEKIRRFQDEITDKSDEIRSTKKELNESGIKNIDTIENRKTTLLGELEKIRSEINSLEVSESLDEARREYSKKRKILADVARRIVQKEAHLEGYQSNLTDLNSKAKALSDLLKVKEFYTDLIKFFPSQIESNLREYEEFFQSLQEDRKEYYSSLIRQLKHDLKELSARKAIIEREVDELSSRFQAEQIVSDIATLTLRESRCQNQISELERFRALLLESERVEEEISSLQRRKLEALESGKEDEKSGRTKRKEMIGVFHSLLQDIFRTTDGNLEFEFIQNPSSTIAGRTEISCAIPSQASHGRTYSRINLFDFVWFLRHREGHEFNPQFLIHDGSYAKISREVKTQMLQAVSERIGLSKQYIVTINEGELDDLDHYTENISIILDGSTLDGKFFKEQFD